MRLIHLVTLTSQSVLGQVVDLINPSVVVSGTIQELSAPDWPYSGVSDEDGFTRFVGFQALQDQTLQIDLQSSQSVQSLYMQAFSTSDPSIDYNVYIGDADDSGDYRNINSMCYVSQNDGLAECIGTGRYIIWSIIAAQTTPAFASLDAFAKKNVGAIAHGDLVTSSGLIVTSGLLDKLHGPSDSSVDCVSGDVSTSSFSVTIKFFKSVEVSDVAIFVQRDSSNYLQTIQVDTMVEGTTSNCGTMTWAGGIRNSIGCSSTLMAKEVTFTFAQSRSSVNYLCKLGVFGRYCYDLPYTITEDPFSGNTVFDLLSETTKDVTLPTFTISILGCYDKTWKVYLQADNSDMEVTSPTIFAIADPVLTLSHVISNYAQRKSLFGSKTYYFVGTTATIPTPTISSQFSFTIDFQDACQSSTITMKIFGITPVKFDLSQTQTEPAFTDSVDATGSLAQGICGEKLITLDAGAPAFLTLTADADPINNPFSIAYDKTQAVEADIKVHTVSYTVTSKEYSGIVADTSGTFIFEITCPDNVMTSSLDTATVAATSYDLASGTTSSLTLPVVSVNPSACFTVSTYEVTDNATGSAVPYATVTATHVDINSQDWGLTGVQTLMIKAVISNGEKLQPHTTAITFMDTCSTLVPTITEDPFVGGTTTFDLLQDTSTNVALPIVTVTPAGCAFTTSWAIKRQSDNQDMTALISSVFAVVNPNLTLTHTISDFAQRQSLFGSDSYYFIGTASDSHSTTTSQFGITIDFVDACRSATVQPLSFSMTFPIYRVDTTKQFNFNAFTDSVDVTGVYPIGICGEKEISLDVGGPAFLQLTPDVSDPILNPFTLDYDDSLSIDADVNLVHAVAYTVKFNEYSGITPEKKTTFSFEVKCPASVISSTLDTAITSSSKYDVANPKSHIIAAPAITLVPSVCFHIKRMELFFTENPASQPKFVKVTPTEFELKTDDRKLIGVQKFTTRAVINNDQILHQQDFEVEIYDSCARSQNTIFTLESVPIGTLKHRALEQKNLTHTLQPYVDQVSFDYDALNLCGCKRYTLYNSFLKDASDIITISHESCGTKVEINVDTSSFANRKTFFLIMRVELIDYPGIKPSDQEFKLVIEPASNAWTPTLPEAEKKEEKAKPVIEEPAVPVIIPEPTLQARPINEADLLANKLRELVDPVQFGKPYPVPYIKSVNPFGEVEVVFTKPLQTISPKIDLTWLEYNPEPEVWMPVLTVKIEPSLVQDPIKVQMSWKVTDITPTSMSFKLLFEEPLWISYEQADTLVIDFADDELFITREGIKIPEEFKILRRKIMRQVPDDSIALQTDINLQASNSKWGAFGVLAVNILFSVGLQEMFASISALQILILLPLLKTSIPANSGMVFEQLTKIAAFDILEIGEYVDEYLNLDPTEPINEKFDTLGLETLYFINNVGSFIFVIIFYQLALLVYFILACVGKFSQKAKQISVKLGAKLFWNSIITVVFQSFLIVTFCVCILWKYNLNFDTVGLRIQTTAGLISMTGYILIPVISIIQLLINFKKTTDRKFTRKYGALYANLDVKKGRQVIINRLVFLARRVLIAYTIIFGTRGFVFQFMLAIGSQILIVMSFYLVNQFDQPFTKRMETFTEMIVLYVCHLFFLFNVVTVEQNYLLGYLPIGVVAFYILVSLIFILRKIYASFRAKFLYKVAVRKFKKQRVQHKEFLRINHHRRRLRLRQMQRQPLYDDKNEDNDAEQSQTDSSSQSSSSSEYQSSNSGSDSLSQSQSQSVSSSQQSRSFHELKISDQSLSNQNIRIHQQSDIASHDYDAGLEAEESYASELSAAQEHNKGYKHEDLSHQDDSFNYSGVNSLNASTIALDPNRHGRSHSISISENQHQQQYENNGDSQSQTSLQANQPIHLAKRSNFSENLMKEINEMDTIFDSMDKQKMQKRRRNKLLVNDSKLEQIVEEDQAEKSKEQITFRVQHSDLPSDQSIPLEAMIQEIDNLLEVDNEDVLGRQQQLAQSLYSEQPDTIRVGEHPQRQRIQSRSIDAGSTFFSNIAGRDSHQNRVSGQTPLDISGLAAEIQPPDQQQSHVRNPHRRRQPFNITQKVDRQL